MILKCGVSQYEPGKLDMSPYAFRPSTLLVKSAGDGSTKPVIHPVPFGATWEWSAVDPDVIYFLNGNQIAKYNKSTKATVSLI